MIDGVNIMMGGQEYIIPPLNFGAIRRLQPQLECLAPMDDGSMRAIDDTQIDAIVSIVHAAIIRNYPDISRSVIEDGIDLANMAQVMDAVMAQSGLQQGGRTEPGEVPSPSTGTGSTVTSSLPRDGVGSISTNG